ncbi:MAG: DUF3592 domain-containing protein [Clostridiales bacterium]|nr:DUF3592 domain-containing protein [Clostridiales bacterium]
MYKSRSKVSWFYVILMILFFVIGSFLLLIGGVTFMINKPLTDSCTAVTYGVVVSVDVDRDRIGTSRTWRARRYAAKVEPEDRSIFYNNSTITGGRTDHYYRKGERVEIYYDPSNPYTYYIQYANPVSEGGSLLAYGACLIVFGLGALVISKIKR